MVHPLYFGVVAVVAVATLLLSFRERNRHLTNGPRPNPQPINVINNTNDPCSFTGPRPKPRHIDNHNSKNDPRTAEDPRPRRRHIDVHSSTNDASTFEDPRSKSPHIDVHNNTNGPNRNRPIIIYDVTCSICLDDFHCSNDSVILQCGHPLHMECASIYQKHEKVASNNCPVCNADIDW